MFILLRAAPSVAVRRAPSTAPLCASVAARSMAGQPSPYRVVPKQQRKTPVLLADQVTTVFNPERHVIQQNFAMKKFAEKGDGESALRTFRELQATGLPVGHTEWNHLLRSLSQTKLRTEFDTLLAEMTASGIEPRADEYTVAALMSEYGLRGDFESAERVFTDRRKNGGGVSRDTVRLMMKLAGQMEQLDYVIKLFNDVAAKGQTDIVMYTLLMRAYGRAGKLSEVLQTFLTMEKKFERLDHRSYSALVTAVGLGCKMPEKALEIYTRYKKAGNRPNRALYHSLLLAFIPAPARPDLADVVWNEMIDDHFYRDPLMWDCMFQVYIGAAPQRVRYLFKAMTQPGVIPSPNTVTMERLREFAQGDEAFAAELEAAQARWTPADKHLDPRALRAAARAMAGESASDKPKTGKAAAAAAAASGAKATAKAEGSLLR